MTLPRTLDNPARRGPAKRPFRRDARRPVVPRQAAPGSEAMGLYGPWSPGLKSAERSARFRGLAALVAVFRGSGCSLVHALRAAERDSDAAARAFVLFEELPALSLRRILSTFAAIHSPAMVGGDQK
jgi:hypothetical protein